MAPRKTTAGMTAATTFTDDLTFLTSHSEVIVLSNLDRARLAVVPTWQARVMTTTVQVEGDPSFGWINRELIRSGKIVPQFNAFGGEDRLWLGPEGGQYSIFFPPGASFELAHWCVPASLDTQPFQLISRSANCAQFEASFTLANYAGTQFEVLIRREVRLLDAARAWQELGMAPPENVALIAYQSANVLKNAGARPWIKDSGLLSVWVLGMFPAGRAAMIAIPIKAGSIAELGPIMTSDYFGAIPTHRLKSSENAVFLSADGQFRCKLGISARRSLGKLASYDAERNVLTVVQYNQPTGMTDYVDSRWMIQPDPYSGDAINAYNDGPPGPRAKPLGAFFELESSSPAAALQPGEQIEHIHRTFHLVGPQSALDAVSKRVLGLSLHDVKTALLPEGCGLC
jgi:hypothetical protein